MDSDLLLVIGIVIGVLAIPALLSAYSEDRAPRAGAIAVLIAGVLIVVAVNNKPGGYKISQLPDAFYRVIGHYIK